MLRVIPDPAAPRRTAPYLATGVVPRLVSGFYDEERDQRGPFHWMGAAGELAFPPRPGPCYLELRVFSQFYDLTQELTAVAPGGALVFPLPHGWSRLSIALAPGTGGVRLEVNRLFPPENYPGDPRLLAVRIGGPWVHTDAARHDRICRQQRNAVRNQAEMVAGASRLESTPASLGIDLYGACNVKPPCVYCEWDVAKEREGADVDTPFTLATLAEYGPFFDGAAQLVNCSIGEPFMMKELDELLDRFGDDGKTLEMATNGQILTERNIAKLVGREVDLYVSLDAATPATYAKLRNDKLDKILVNLRRLIAAKGGRGALPRVNLVFMPMPVNLGELEAFVRLAAELDVDRLVLRPLNYGEGIALEWERAGYRFSYQDELLPFAELVRASGRAAALCRRWGVDLSNQLDFGGATADLFGALYEQGYQAGLAASAGPPPPSAPAAAAPPGGAEPAAVAAAPAAPLPAQAAPPAVASPPPSLGAERLPICHEPWKSLYILRRGVMPCCYGAEPIAPMRDYRAAWNSPILRDIRHELAAGRFHRYCLDSPSCPMVRKSENAGGLPWRQRAWMEWQRLRLRGRQARQRLATVLTGGRAMLAARFARARLAFAGRGAGPRG